MYNSRRSATVQSRGYSTLIKIGQHEFQEIMRKSPSLHSCFVQQISSYTDINKTYIIEACKKWPLYSVLDQDDQNALTFNFELAAFKKNTLIQTTGETPKCMSIIMKGIAELYVSLGEYNLRAEFLRPGDIFNQNLFLLGIPVQVNIKCLSDLEVLQLHSDKVNHLRKMKDESTLNTEI